MPKNVLNISIMSDYFWSYD